MRSQMAAALTARLGPSVRSREGCDWWIVSRAASGKPQVHVCLNAPGADFAHVLIFDPAPPDGQHVTDVSAHTQAEFDAVMRHLDGLNGRDGKH